MKYFTLFLTMTVMAAAEVQELSEQEQRDREALRNHCIESSKVNEDQLEKIRNGIYEDDAKLKNFFKCVYVKIGLLDGEGNPHLEILRKRWGGHVEDLIIEKIIENCSQKKDRIEDTALHFNKCAHEYRNGLRS